MGRALNNENIFPKQLNIKYKELERLQPNSPKKQIIEPKLIAYVINLPEREDRWNIIKEKWKDIFDDMIRVDGIRSKTPHAGCGLAHLNACKMSFARDNTSPAIVLEDDIIPNENLTSTTLRAIFQEAIIYQENFDALYLRAVLESNNVRLSKTNSKIFFQAEASESLYCNAFMFYSIRIQKFLPIYEDHLLDEKLKVIIPIDRLFTNSSFSGYKWNKPISWITDPVCELIDIGISDNTGPSNFTKTPMYMNSKKNLEYVKLRAKPIQENLLNITLNGKSVYRTNETEDINKQTEDQQDETEDVDQTTQCEWRKIGSEGDTITLTTSSELRYGYEANWSYLTLSPGTYTLKNKLFNSNPYFKKIKIVEQLFPDPLCKQDEAVENWVNFGLEKDILLIQGPCKLRYGLGKNWSYITVKKSGIYKLNNALFNADPCFDTKKIIQRLE
jgi:GR25 family glycosyltransferase involved in LPS biosynthesis